MILTWVSFTGPAIKISIAGGPGCIVNTVLNDKVIINGNIDVRGQDNADRNPSNRRF